MKRILKKSIIIFIPLILLFFCFYCYCFFKIPNKMYVRDGEKVNLNLFGVTLKCDKKEITVGKNFFNFTNCKKFKAMLLNLIPIKKIIVDQFKDVEVYPNGMAFGIKLLSDGIMIVNMQGVESQDGEKFIGVNAGLKVGDIITHVNGEKIISNEQFAKTITNCDGKNIKLKIKRDEKDFETEIKPEFSKIFKNWQIGLWVRDSSAGIGTITFTTKDGVFGSLGHPLCDVDTNKIIRVNDGDVTRVEIKKVKRGESGDPGELCGVLLDGDFNGKIIHNVDSGLYGKMRQPVCNFHKPVGIGLKQEIKKGHAKIYSTILGDVPEEFDVEIESINLSDDLKNLVIKITDERLLKVTGGIVQGMSGSPIIQNGKLIGALTHVFVNNPTKGYGIFAETMIEDSQNVPEELKIT